MYVHVYSLVLCDGARLRVGALALQRGQLAHPLAEPRVTGRKLQSGATMAPKKKRTASTDPGAEQEPKARRKAAPKAAPKAEAKASAEPKQKAQSKLRAKPKVRAEPVAINLVAPMDAALACAAAPKARPTKRKTHDWNDAQFHEIANKATDQAGLRCISEAQVALARDPGSQGLAEAL